jgi:AmmeMemoRadiSam system protein B
MSLREPAVAGQFYPGSAAELRREVTGYLAKGAGEKITARGCVVPHAGYIYSGGVAGAVYARLNLPKRFIILCPNHTGKGAPLAILSEGEWKTPLGNVRVDSELAAALKLELKLLAEDSVAHRAEHAIEVHLPFLQTLVPDLSLVPIAVGTSQFEVLAALGVALARAIEKVAPGTLIIASSDMNHYESDALTRVKDAKAIDKVLALNPEGLYEVVQREHISMCGYGPTVAMMTAAKRLGATSAELIRYATSGEVSSEQGWVVGYAGIVVK